MKKLLSGAGMPFNEEAFEEQIKDSTYFNLAIAPILRKMPPQKLAVLADLQVWTDCYIGFCNMTLMFVPVCLK